MAAPYITGIPGWSTALLFSGYLLARDCKLNIITGKPRDGDLKTGVLSKTEADLMVAQGVRLLIRTQPFLHAKVYQFHFPEGDRAAFVGSANFSMGGFKTNDEIVAFFSQKCENDGIARQFERLSGSSTEYHHWRTLEAACRTRNNSD
ncbi:MAG: phospholipase D-like domain-containing protein [Gammaproteobacteria bacterium]